MTISTHSQYKKCKWDISYSFFSLMKSSKSSVYFTLTVTSQFGTVTHQLFNSHVWLIAAVLGSAGLETWIWVSAQFLPSFAALRKLPVFSHRVIIGIVLLNNPSHGRCFRVCCMFSGTQGAKSGLLDWLYSGTLELAHAGWQEPIVSHEFCELVLDC